MAHKIGRVRCGTPKCSGFIDKNESIPKSEDGNWQFHCPACGFWSLFSKAGTMCATSRDEFDLTRLPPGLRAQISVTRSPGGGV